MNIKMKEFPKECPFCHDIPTVAKDPLYSYRGNYKYYIACMNQNCKVQPKTKAYTDIYEMTEQECVDKSIEDWNSR